MNNNPQVYNNIEEKSQVNFCTCCYQFILKMNNWGGHCDKTSELSHHL